jgi:hypothetical protein
MIEEADVALLGLRGLLRFALKEIGDRVQSEPLEVVPEAFDIGTHEDASPPIDVRSV